MKRLVVIGVFLSINFGLFQSLSVVINYLVNYEYYSEVLCENKEVEDSCCHGKCAMEKELVSQEEEESPQLPQLNKFKLSESVTLQSSRLILASSNSNLVFVDTFCIPICYLETGDRPPSLNV